MILQSTITGIGDRNKKRFEGRLKACGALGPDEDIGDIVDKVSFDDTLGEIERVVEGDLSENRVISVNSVKMYEVITNFEKEIGVHRTARVDTKYKTVDRKVRSIAANLLEDSLERIKGVITDPSLRAAVGIEHRFTDKTLLELKFGGGGVLLSAEEDLFRRMLERHGKPLYSHREKSDASTRPLLNRW